MKKMLIITVITLLLVMTMAACTKPTAKQNNQEKVESTSEVSNDSEAVVTEEASEAEETNPVEEKASTAYELTEDGIITPEFAKKTIEEDATKLIAAITSKDTEVMAGYIHPEKGVRFTAYTNVSIEYDVIMKPEEIKKFFEDQNTYIWGSYDGTGEDISLTPSQYYDEFINTADFVNAEKIGYNEVLSSGNMEENQFEVYENAIVVEYYFSGMNPDFEGADWQSLRLVFEPYENGWKLVGIIHNQATV